MRVKSPMDTRSTYPFSANHSEDLSLNPFDFFWAHSCKSFSLENQPRDFYSRMHVSSWYALVNLWLNPKRKISDGWFSEIQILILYCQILYTILQYWKYISGGSLFLSWGVPNSTPIQTPCTEPVPRQMTAIFSAARSTRSAKRRRAAEFSTAIRERWDWFAIYTSVFFVANPNGTSYIVTH